MKIIIDIPQHVKDLMEEETDLLHRFRPEVILSVWLQQNAGDLARKFVDENYHNQRREGRL
jgi:hypothetical protein